MNHMEFRSFKTEDIYVGNTIYHAHAMDIDKLVICEVIEVGNCSAYLKVKDEKDVFFKEYFHLAHLHLTVESVYERRKQFDDYFKSLDKSVEDANMDWEKNKGQSEIRKGFKIFLYET